jgi:hypothetical protein
VVSEKAPVDEQNDTTFKISAEGYTIEGVGRWTNTGFTNKWAL